MEASQSQDAVGRRQHAMSQEEAARPLRTQCPTLLLLHGVMLLLLQLLLVLMLFTTLPKVKTLKRS